MNTGPVFKLKYYVYICLICLVTAGCGDIDSDPEYSVQEDGVIVIADGLEGINTFTAEGAQKVGPGLRIPPIKQLRFDVYMSACELINLPDDWKKISLYKGIEDSPSDLAEETPAAEVLRENAEAESIPDELSGVTDWLSHNISILIGYGLVTLYFIMLFNLAWTQFAGDGGTVAQIIQLFAFFALARQWENGFFYLTLILIIVLTVLYLFARREEPDYSNLLTVVHLIVYICVCISIFCLLLVEKDYVTRAEWTTHQSISLYIRPDERERIELADGDGTVLKSFSLKPDLKVESLLFWPDEQTPAELRIIKAGEVVRVFDIDDRPEKSD